MYNNRKRNPHKCYCNYNFRSNSNNSNIPMNCKYNKEMLVLSDEINIDENACDCGFKEENTFPKNPVLGQSYVPIQQLEETFTPSDGLNHGSLFPELVKPYFPGQSIEEFSFIKAMNFPKEGCNQC